jgi:transposase
MRMSADMLLAHKIALDPNAAQRRYFARASGTARFAYNWFLAEWKRQYAAGEKPSEGALLRQLHAIKRARFHPSSKTCSCCGVVKQTLALSERTFRCGDCGNEIRPRSRRCKGMAAKCETFRIFNLDDPRRVS